MADDALIRRQSLRALLKARGWAIKDLQEQVGEGRYTYWRDLLENDTKSFGEKVARKIEDKLGLDRGYLDRAQGQATPDASRHSGMPFRDLNAFEAQLITLFRALSPDEQHDHLVELNKRVDKTNGDAASPLNPFAGKDRRTKNVPVEVERRGQFGQGDDQPKGRQPRSTKK